MKALCGVAVLAFGLTAVYFSPPVHAVIMQRCYGGGSVTINGVTTVTPGFCDIIWYDDPPDRSRHDRWDDIDPPYDRPIPNEGDTAAAQRDASEKDCSQQAGNPVVFSTGNKIEPETDFTSLGEMPLSLARTYNYYWNGIGLFGRRWLSDYDYKLLFTTDDPTSSCYPRPGNSRCDPLNKPIWAQRPDGRKIKFNYSATPVPGWYEDKPSPVAKILQTGTTYTLYSEDRTIEVYDYYGFPSTIKNQQNIGWTFTFDSNHYLTRVTHSSGRHVDFGWEGGTLATVTDPAEHVYRYSYRTIALTNALAASSTLDTGAMSANLMMLPPLDPEDPPPTPYNPPSPSMVALLTQVTQPATPGSSPGTTVTYQYEDARFPTALTGKSINAQRYAWFTYNANGRVIETRHANNAERYQFVYTLDSNNAITRTTITNPLNKQTLYDFDAKGNIAGITGVASTHCPATFKTTSYDNNGYPNGVVDFNDNATLLTYAANGQLLQKVAAPQTAITQTTDYTWDPTYHRVTKVVLRGDHETNYRYGLDNRLTLVTVKNLSSTVGASAGESHATTYTSTAWPNGLLKSLVIDGPLAGAGDAMTMIYAETGDLLSSKDALGHTTTYAGYNGLGLPGSVTGPNGDKHTYVYDARGRITDDQTNRNGGTQHTRYEYDGFGRLSRVTQPDGHTHSYQYDVAGRLTSEYEPEGGGTFAHTVYTYNAMSLPVTIKKQRVYAEPQRGTAP